VRCPWQDRRHAGRRPRHALLSGDLVFLQDRFCTAKGDDTKRFYHLAGKLDVDGSPIEDWKLKASVH
jgi:hypothetical protein